MASVIRESLFYEVVIPLFGLAEFVPQYYGTYASCQGGWYAIVLEDVGVPAGLDDFFPEDDPTLKKKFGADDHASLTRFRFDMFIQAVQADI